MELEKIIQDLNQLNFTAIDFETANERRDSICSIGLVVVKQGNIIDKKNILVKPKEFRFTEVNKQIHGIKEQDVIDAPEFDKFWEQIKSMINDQILLVHNADFDIDALKQTLNSYQISIPKINYICTQKLAQETFVDLQNYRLTDVATYLGLNHKHHNSISDATICAEIGIKAIPIYNKKFYNYGYEELTFHIHKKSSAETKKRTLPGFDGKKIESHLLKQNLNVENTNTLFYNKKIVFTGDMKAIGRNEASIKIQKLGADINTTISKKTEIVIIGQGAGPSKMKKIEELKAEGCNIQLIYEEEFLSLLKYIHEI